MAKKIPSAIADKDLDYIKANCNKMTVCSDEPATYADANVDLMLAGQAMVVGDFTIGAHAPDGREIAVAAKAGVTVTNSGNATHIVLLDTVGAAILAVTVCTLQAIVSAGTINIPTWKLINRDPT